MRTDGGFAPIAEYGVLGDGRTSALLAADGRIDWWPLPTLDSPPVFAAMLDPEVGGHLTLVPDEPYEVERCYLDETNVLQTTFIGTTGRVRTTTALNVGTAGRLPWTELAVRIEGLSGRVPMRWDLIPGTRFGQTSPWVSSRGSTPIVSLGNQTLAVVTSGMGTLTVGPHRVHGEFVAEAGVRELLACTATDGEPIFIPTAVAIDDRIDRTIESWCRWSQQLVPLGRWTPITTRSALALKTLITESSGSIAAAVTTSLPERIGGDKNWDYRYAWVRDSSFTIDALISLGLHEEAHGAVSWILNAVRRNGPDLRVFYTLDGSAPGGEADLAAPGYRQSAPVRDGNGAATQIQLGTYGDFFDTIFRYTNEGHVLDPGTGRMLADLADRCCDDWRAPDSGIWELEGSAALHHLQDRLLGGARPCRPAGPGRADSHRAFGALGGGGQGHPGLGRSVVLVGTEAGVCLLRRDRGSGCLGAPGRPHRVRSGPSPVLDYRGHRGRTRPGTLVRTLLRCRSLRRRVRGVHVLDGAGTGPHRAEGSCRRPHGGSGRTLQRSRSAVGAD